MDASLELNSRYGMHTEEFSDLMAYRVGEILLVASQYDAFTLEEDGQLAEQVFREYKNLDLNPRYTPRFTHAYRAAEALELLDSRSFDLVITTPRIGEADLKGFCRKVKENYGNIPVAVLAAHAWDLPRLTGIRESGAVDWVFLWQGDVKVLLAILKQVEDHGNADIDVQHGVQVIILVEDEVRFFSSYLPMIYTEITQQTGRLVDEGLNLSHRLLRIRARPKILLAQSYEEALELYTHFGKNVLGIISDIRFSRDGVETPDAGLMLTNAIRQRDPDVPILLQSSERENETRAHEAGAAFLWKKSPQLLEEIQEFILAHFGFGDFIFRTPDGKSVGRAKTLKEIISVLEIVPDESIEYHAHRNHFSRWLKARSEFELASLLKPRKVSEFPSITDLRKHLIKSIRSYLGEIQRHIITDFEIESFDEFVSFARLGRGSLGGKGRGLAFMHKLLSQSRVDIPDVQITIPETAVIASDIFEEFVEENDLLSYVVDSDSQTDGEILDRFRSARFNHDRRSELAKILQHTSGPLAIRSSSILEDSLYQPFAGVYATIMLPNIHPSLDVRLAQLLEAVKVVYASTYFKAAREYLRTTPHRLADERMAVLIQKLVGNRYDTRFYPTLSGVALSWNFYPIKGMAAEDGVSQIALGLGKTVVDGFDALRFCPRYPEILPQFTSTKDILKNAQRKFYALDMSKDSVIPGIQYDENLNHLDVSEAIGDGAADVVASTYDPVNDRISEGLQKGGSPLITFTGLLQEYVAPLPTILDRLLHISQNGFGMPVEIEFAMNLAGYGKKQLFHVLQVRPMVVEKVETDVDIEELASCALPVITSESALGHGRVMETHDIILVDQRLLDRSQTRAVTEIIERLNNLLRSRESNYLLIGPGRWGSSDSWLGIPVAWHQISSAGAIVETDFKDFEVEPSQGSHFFHDLTTFGVAYLTVHQTRSSGTINWEWLDSLAPNEVFMDGIVRYITSEYPLKVYVDGKSSKGVILMDTC